MTTELQVPNGMQIQADPETGAIASSNELGVHEVARKPADDQPGQTPEALADEPKVAVDPRKAIMDKIYANRGEQFKRELQYAASFEPERADGEDLPTVPEPQEAQSAEPSQAQAPARAPEHAPEQPSRRAINVNGQVLELTQAEIDHLAQRAIYASQQPQAYQPQAPQPLAPPSQAQQLPRSEGVDPNALKEIARRITYGSEDESVGALQDLVGLTTRLAQQPNGPTPDQIASAAAQRAVAQVQFENNLNAIGREYADIFNDSDMTVIAARKVGELRSKNNVLGVQKSDLDLYREACQLTREKFGRAETTPVTNKTLPAEQPLAPALSQGRVERKRAAPQPAAAVNRTQAMEQTNRAPTASDIVNAMRKQRGQAAI